MRRILLPVLCLDSPPIRPGGKLTKAGHTEAFVAHAWKAGKVEGASGWAEANESKLADFLAWSKDYRWPVD